MEKKAGVYFFTLTCTSEDGSGYTYDHSSYTVRLYAKDNTSDSFITVQNDETGYKVDDVKFGHRYVAPRDGNDGSGNDNGSDKKSTTPTNPDATDKTAANISDDGNTGTTGNDQNNGSTNGDLPRIEEEGNHAPGKSNNGSKVYATGDNSNIVLYGIVVAAAATVLGIWFFTKQKEGN